MNNLSQIIQKLNASKPLLTAQYQLSEIGVFGSYVRNEQTDRSDLDILVDFKETPGLFKFIELENKLSELLNVKVDLVHKTSLKPDIGKQILSEVVMV